MDASLVIGAITEIFSWFGFGGGAVLAIAWLIARAVDGTWVPVRGVVIESLEPPVVRWFGDGHRVGEAWLTEELRQAADANGEVELFTDPRRPGSGRIHQRSPLRALFGWGAIGFSALGVVSAAVQLILLAIG